MLDPSRLLAGTLAPLLLGGCISGDTDLIGEHASVVLKSDQVFAFSGAAYWLNPSGPVSEVCYLGEKSDLADPCDHDTTVMLERTARRNYIVQVGMEHFDSFVPMVWFRSERREGKQPLFACVIPIDDEHQDMILPDPPAGAPPLQALVDKAVGAVANTEQLDRAGMLKLVDLYESTLQPVRDGPVACPVNRTAIDEQRLEIREPETTG